MKCSHWNAFGVQRGCEASMTALLLAKPVEDEPLNNFSGFVSESTHVRAPEALFITYELLL